MATDPSAPGRRRRRLPHPARTARRTAAAVSVASFLGLTAGFAVTTTTAATGAAATSTPTPTPGAPTTATGTAGAAVSRPSDDDRSATPGTTGSSQGQATTRSSGS